MITYHLFSAEFINRSSAQLSAIYAEAFMPAPYFKTGDEVANFTRDLPAATERDGFCAFVAQHASISQPVGFCYGYTYATTGDFHEVVYPHLADTYSLDRLNRCFQLVEMAVLPDYQGRGIGRTLHDQLLETQPHPHAILATMNADTPASRLYQHAGWRTILTNLTQPALNRPYKVMVRDTA